MIFERSSVARPLTRAQRLENCEFLKQLERTGNVRLAAREAGLKYGTMQHRRRQHPAFAARWDAALVHAQARLNAAARKPKRSRHASDPKEAAGRFRTAGGEAVVVRLRSGKLQVRRAQAGKLTPEAEQAFLAALSATANVTLSAAAVGANPMAFYRRMKRSHAFARERRLAIQRGYDRLELALLESMAAASHEHDEWRSNEPPALPPMSVNQALQAMYLHQKEARLTAEPDYLKRRRGESREAHSMRLAAMAEERDRLAREEFELAEAARWAAGQPAWGPAGEAVRRGLGLPDLAQVSGWSKADPAKEAHDPDTALFGGWRLEQMVAELEAREVDWCEPEEPERPMRRVRKV